MKKMCAICGKAKEEEEFRIKRQKISGKVYTYRHSYCRECERWYMRRYLREYMPGYLKRKREKENDERRNETVNARSGNDRRADRG